MQLLSGPASVNYFFMRYFTELLSTAKSNYFLRTRRLEVFELFYHLLCMVVKRDYLLRRTKIFGPARNDISGAWRDCHNDSDLHSSSSIVKFVKLGQGVRFG